MTGENGTAPGGVQDGVPMEEEFQTGGEPSTSATAENFAIPAPVRGVGETMMGSVGGADNASFVGDGIGGPVDGNGGGGASRNLQQSEIPQPSSSSSVKDNLRAIGQRLLMAQNPISQSSKGSGDAGAAKTYKQMLETVKKMEAAADKLQERISGLHCEFGDAVLKGAFMFDPSFMDIMQSGPPGVGGELRNPSTAHFTRQAVDEEYERLIKRLEARPAPMEEEEN